MARYEHLPIWHDAMRLAVHLERSVARFPRYHKYTLGAELRRGVQSLLGAIMRCASARETRTAELERLILIVEQVKTQLALAREIRVFASFNDFAQAAETAVVLGRQSEGWLRQVRRKAGPEAASHRGDARA